MDIAHGPTDDSPWGPAEGRKAWDLGASVTVHFIWAPCLLWKEGRVCLCVCVLGGTYSGHTLRSRLHLDVEGE